MKAEDASLARLAVLAQRGDRTAYATFLAECQHWLRRYFARKVGAEYLDDLVQETLLSVHAKLASYDPKRPLLPWLAAIARYRWVDQLRRIYKAGDTAEAGDGLTDAFDSESEIAARISLERLFAHLPEGQVRAIERVKIEGLSVAEAATASGQSVALVKVNIHRGLKKLAALIEKA